MYRSHESSSHWFKQQRPKPTSRIGKNCIPLAGAHSLRLLPTAPIALLGPSSHSGTLPPQAAQAHNHSLSKVRANVKQPLYVNSQSWLAYEKLPICQVVAGQCVVLAGPRNLSGRCRSVRSPCRPTQNFHDCRTLALSSKFTSNSCSDNPEVSPK